MWTPDDITVAIDDVEGSETVVAIGTPSGTIVVQGDITLRDGVLTIDGAHVQGLSAGALGRAGLNAIARKILEETDARELVIQGGTRSTGRNPGRPPHPIRFPR